MNANVASISLYNSPSPIQETSLLHKDWTPSKYEN